VRVRKLFKMRGFFFSPSLDGGFELLELSKPRRRRSSALSASSASIRRNSEAIRSSTSGGRLIPPLSQKSASLSRKIRVPKSIKRWVWHFRLTRLGSY